MSQLELNNIESTFEPDFESDKANKIEKEVEQEVKYVPINAEPPLTFSLKVFICFDKRPNER